MSVWNPWHGCTRLGNGCKGCVVFRVDAAHGRNTELVRKTKAFDLPVRKDRNREYKLRPEGGLVETCCTSDFFHTDADPWRKYTADRRLPVFLRLPVCHKRIVLEPMLQAINIERYLEKYSAEIEEVSCGGETGEDAREMDYAWVIGMHLQCVKYDVPFRFRRTGTHFRRGGKLFTIEKEEQELQAARANINYKI